MKTFFILISIGLLFIFYTIDFHRSNNFISLEPTIKQLDRVLVKVFKMDKRAYKEKSIEKNDNCHLVVKPLKNKKLALTCGKGLNFKYLSASESEFFS